jgi:hypothetical protein
MNLHVMNSRKGKGKIFPVQATKAYRAGGGMLPLILNLDARWRRTHTVFDMKSRQEMRASSNTPPNPASHIRHIVSPKYCCCLTVTLYISNSVQFLQDLLRFTTVKTETLLQEARPPPMQETEEEYCLQKDLLLQEIQNRA